MVSKHYKSSGLDIEGMMNDIDNREEIHQETINLEELLTRFKHINSETNKLLNHAEDLKGDMFACTETLWDTCRNIRGMVDDLSQTLIQAQNSKITTNLDDMSVNTINQLHKKFLKEEKNALEELARSRQSQIDGFRYDFTNALNKKGFWCSAKIFWWLFGLTFVSTSIIVIEIMIWFLLKFHLI